MRHVSGCEFRWVGPLAQGEGSGPSLLAVAHQCTEPRRGEDHVGASGQRRTDLIVRWVQRVEVTETDILQDQPLAFLRDRHGSNVVCFHVAYSQAGACSARSSADSDLQSEHMRALGFW